ncbi:MAG: exo-alpha-sialidase [Lentisphaerae bacterium]|nr:exo-alpha-sialidase [Lentisphaerota bacterium]MBT4815392.1 exo-alpha-sialidase [Lentisphaerota bacterium]MBT5612302.1 exo-alpha-sialidase [Lentisphaerota bacterium]MBT7060720.1 exo-alpha-sialidase [Lentisphaerota bacterium]MBT7845281.1 exo-alpha-sialidase [Lentisphaerota bacterium]
MVTRGVLAAFVFAAVGAIRAEPVGPGIAWTRVYSADVLPDACGWGTSKGAETRSELTPDGLHIVDGGTRTTQLHCFSRSWSARAERGGAAQATLRLISCTGRSGMCLHVSDGTHEDSVTFYPDRIRLAGSDLEYAMDTTDTFHTYLIRFAGINIEVWVDGKLAIDGWGSFIKPAHNGRRTVMFGSISSAATGEAYWKDVRFASAIVAAEQVEGANNVIIYRREGVYACFPNLKVLPDGRWITSFGTRSRRSHIDNTGGSARYVSNDEGLTWARSSELLPDPRMVREDGTAINPHARGWVYVDEAELPAIRERGRRWMSVRKGTVAYLGDPRVRFRHPDGTTSRVLELPCPAPAGVMSFHQSCSFLRLGKVWLTAIYGSESPKGRSGVWGIRSEDDGETWDVVQIAAPRSIGLGFNETAVCANGQGEMVAMMRPKDGAMNTFQCFSSDGGKTWGPPEDTGAWGYPSHVLLLRDGRLLWSRGYRRDAMGVRALVSADGGHTWDLKNEIIVRADGTGNGGDNGYPISAQKTDGDVFTLYYINDNENVTHVAGTHWPLPGTK